MISITEVGGRMENEEEYDTAVMMCRYMAKLDEVQEDWKAK